jgi:hypothetical protein
MLQMTRQKNASHLRNKLPLLFGTLLLTLVACNAAPTSSSESATPATMQATSLPSAAPVTVRQLIDDSEKSSGQAISLAGQIVLECPEGCWFFLDDGTGKIHVDLKPAGLTIPQKVGSRITLLGRTKGAGGNLQVPGEDVKFSDSE